MIVLSSESTVEFAAKRRARQDDLIEGLLPLVTDALALLEQGDADWKDDLLTNLAAIFRLLYEEEGGEHDVDDESLDFTDSLKDTLDKSKPDSSAQTIAVWLATAVINAAAVQAVADDPEPIVLEWTTMHDDDVRSAHRDADGQQRPPGEDFLIDSVEMPYPGWPGAPIELWINCRCTLRPALAGDVPFALTAAISEKPWSGAASRFSETEWKRSCIVHVCDGMEKSCHKLPIREPGGALSRAGVHAAASRLNQVDAPPEKIASAKRALRGAYKQLGEDPPESITAGGTMDETEVEEVAPVIRWHGVLAPEGVKSGDGRSFAPNSLRTRDLPLPLTWQKVSDEHHKGSVTVAKIEQIVREDGLMKASGYFLQTPEADEVVGLIAEFGRFGVSVDADDPTFEIDEETGEVMFTSARIASSAIVPIPAFAEAWVALGDWPEPLTGESLAAAAPVTARRGPGWITNPADTKRLHDYWTKPGEEGYIKIGWGKGGDFNRCRVLVGEKIAANSPEDLRFLNQICAQWHHDALGIWPGEHKAAAEAEEFTETSEAVSLVAAGGWCAPSEFFEDPQLPMATPLTITKEGRVFGHVAEWTTCHIGYEGMCVAPPHSVTGYAHFLYGEIDLTDGRSIPVGTLTYGTGHAPEGLRARAAAAHYDNTASVFAYVTCGEDAHGIWISGALKPTLTPEQITEVKAAKLSGDWRKIGASMEMVAALAVNVPGFGIPRVRVAASLGQQISLTAAGIVDREVQEAEDTVAEFAEKIAAAIEDRQKRREKMAALAAKMKGE